MLFVLSFTFSLELGDLGKFPEFFFGLGKVTIVLSTLLGRKHRKMDSHRSRMMGVELM